MRSKTKRYAACAVCTTIAEGDQVIFLHFRTCSGFHIACHHCAKIFKHRTGYDQNFKCHLCRENLQYGDQTPIGLQYCDKTVIQEGKTLTKEIKSVLAQQISEGLQQIALSFGDYQSRKCLKQFLSQARDAMKIRHYDRAISLLTWIITNHFEEIERIPFLGLGSADEAFEFSDFEDCEWYWQRYGHNLSPYDQLGLCCLLRFPSVHQRDWFKLMCKAYPSSFKLLYGLALTEHNLRNFEAAIHLYFQIIKMEPEFSKPFEMLAFIYNKLGQREKALMFAEKCLNVQSTNIFAKLIRAKLQKPTQSQICKDLEQLYCIQPTYLHIINEIIKKYFVIYNRNQRESRFRELQQRQTKKSITCCYLRIEKSKAQYYQHARRIQVKKSIHPGRFPKYVELRLPSLNIAIYWYPQTVQSGNPLNYLNLAVLYNYLRRSEKAVMICLQYLSFYPCEPLEIKRKIKLELMCAYLSKTDAIASQLLIEELSAECFFENIGEASIRLGSHFEAIRDLKKSIEWYKKCMSIGYRWNWCCIKIFLLLLQQQNIRQAEDMIDQYVAKNKERNRNPFVLSKIQYEMKSEVQWVIIENENKFDYQDTKYFRWLIRRQKQRLYDCQ